MRHQKTGAFLLIQIAALDSLFSAIS